MDSPNDSWRPGAIPSRRRQSLCRGPGWSDGSRRPSPAQVNKQLSATANKNQIRNRNQLKRGSSLLWRYYSGPQMIVGDKVHPLDSSKLRSPLKAA